MADDAIIFGLANPTPEVHPDVAHRHARVVATGRSDYPNQINNVLAFPGIFRGTFDVRATSITEGMKLAAANALADLVGDDLSEEYVVPSPFDPRVAPAVSAAVAARGEGGRRRPTLTLPRVAPGWLGSGHVRRLRRVLLLRRPAVRAARGGAARPGPGERLDDHRRQGRLAQPPRPVVAARRRAQGGRAADDPRLRRRGSRRGRQRGRRARGGERPVLDRGRDPRPEAVAAQRALPGHAGRQGRGPAAQRGAQAGLAELRGGRLPADRLADRLPDALHPGRPQARRQRAGAGRRRRGVHGADRAGTGRRAAGLRDQPRRGQADARPRPRRPRGLREQRPAAAAGRRRHGDGRATRPGRTR